MSQQVGLKVQLASDFGKLSTIGLGAVVKLVNRVDELEKENVRLREALNSILEVDEDYLQGDVDEMRSIATQALEETK